MESGVINEDSFSNILRSISQRKKNGVLEITLTEGQLSVSFVKGKVVEVQRADESPAAEVIKRLVASGWLPQGMEFSVQDYAEAARLIKTLQLPRGALSDELFRRAVKQRILDLLYDLDAALKLGGGAYYVFKAQMIVVNEDFSPSISSGQILLDLVSLKQDQSRFLEAFSAGEMLRRGDNGEGLSEEEELVWKELADGGASIEDVARRSMLSRFHLQDALLGMLERGVIVRGGASAVQTQKVLASEPPTASSAASPELTDSPATPAATIAGVASVALHVRLLQDVRVPYVLMVIGLAAGILAPLVFWGEIWGEF